VIAGIDCGFRHTAGRATVHPELVWAKLGRCPRGPHWLRTALALKLAPRHHRGNRPLPRTGGGQGRGLPAVRGAGNRMSQELGLRLRDEPAPGTGAHLRAGRRTAALRGLNARAGLHQSAGRPQRLASLSRGRRGHRAVGRDSFKHTAPGRVRAGLELSPELAQACRVDDS